MRVSFPYPVKVTASVPKLTGLRLSPFTNIDNESFAKPALNGFWELDVNILADDMQSQLAMSVFVTQMEAAGAVCVVPVTVQHRPNNASGRMLAHNDSMPAFSFDHLGFENDPFDGFTLRSAAAHRDSFIAVNKPALSQLWPGHYITIEDRLYQVTNVSAIDESETAIRVSVMPNIRGDHAAGKVVVVDQLRLACRMRQGDQIGWSKDVVKRGAISFVEAF